MTRLADRLANLEASLARLAAPGVLEELADRLTTADGWIARGYPTGTSGNGGRSADRSSSTERAAEHPDHLGERIAAIHDHLDQLATAARHVLTDHTWLQPTTIDPTTPDRTATCMQCGRVVAGIPDARNKAGLITRLNDPIKAGRCRECHTTWVAASRTARPIDRDPTTGRLCPVSEDAAGGA